MSKVVNYIVSYKKTVEAKTSYTKHFSAYLSAKEFVKDLFRAKYGKDIIVAVYNVADESHMDKYVDLWREEVENE